MSNILTAEEISNCIKDYILEKQLLVPNYIIYYDNKSCELIEYIIKFNHTEEYVSEFVITFLVYSELSHKPCFNLNFSITSNEDSNTSLHSCDGVKTFYDNYIPLKDLDFSSIDKIKLCLDDIFAYIYKSNTTPIEKFL